MNGDEFKECRDPVFLAPPPLEPNPRLLPTVEALLSHKCPAIKQFMNLPRSGTCIRN
jgi:hypothetical protein